MLTGYTRNRTMLFARNSKGRVMKCLACCMSLVLVPMSYLSAPAQAGEDYMAAGIALVARDGQVDLVFLVRHHSRSWYEMPGGRRQTAEDAKKNGDVKRSETAYQTAIRECFEEAGASCLPGFFVESLTPPA
jgi:hypothetical protein